MWMNSVSYLDFLLIWWDECVTFEEICLLWVVEMFARTSCWRQSPTILVSRFAMSPSQDWQKALSSTISWTMETLRFSQLTWIQARTYPYLSSARLSKLLYQTHLPKVLDLSVMRPGSSRLFQQYPHNFLENVKFPFLWIRKNLGFLK